MKKNIIVSINIILLLGLFYALGSTSTVLSTDELPGVGQTLVLTSNTTIVINETDTSVISGLKILGESSAPITVNITVDGELNLTGIVNCTYATLSVINTGMLHMDLVMVHILGNSTVSFSNQGNWTLSDVNIQVYGGLLYLANYGTMIGQNLYFKDQYDGTFIHNEGEAKLQDIVLVANGAMGAFHLTNQGTMTLIRTYWDVNYGGTIDLNSLFGELSVSNGSIDVSGASHGQDSTVNIVDGNTTWDHCTFVVTSGTMSYAASGAVCMPNCTIHTRLNGSFLMSNSGILVYSDGLMEGTGYVNIHNQESFTLLNSVYNTSGSINLVNRGTLSLDHCLLRTTNDTGRVHITNFAEITFVEPFIEDVSAEALLNITEDGADFLQRSGGLVLIYNNGSIIQQDAIITSSSDLTSYSLILVLVCVVILILIVLIRKKKKK